MSKRNGKRPNTQRVISTRGGSGQRDNATPPKPPKQPTPRPETVIMPARQTTTSTVDPNNFLGLTDRKWNIVLAVVTLVIGGLAAKWGYEATQIAKHAAAIAEQENVSIFTQLLIRDLDDPSEYDRAAHGLIKQIPKQPLPQDIKRIFGTSPGYPIKPEHMLLRVTLANNGASAITALSLQFSIILTLRTGCVFHGTPASPSVVTTASAPINTILVSGRDASIPPLTFAGNANLPIAPGSSRTFAFKNMSQVYAIFCPLPNRIRIATTYNPNMHETNAQTTGFMGPYAVLPPFKR